MANQIKVDGTTEQSIRRFLDELKERLLLGTLTWGWALPRLQAVSDGIEFVPSFDGEVRIAPRRTRAQKRQQWFERWYRDLGFEINVPVPNVSAGQIKRKEMEDKKLFYCPATSEMAYDAYMCAVGQDEHWTVTHEGRNKIKWETAEQGYWFWAEVADDCPRTSRSWNDLSGSIRLLSLEEYVIVWHAHKAQTKKLLDLRTWIWLRTRYRFDEKTLLGALSADECGGSVCVDLCHPGDLSIASSGGGGRLAEVVKSVA